MLGSIVTKSERETLLADALIRAASESGYADIDVDRVARYAGLGADDFYASFTDLEHCLLAAFERFLERLDDHMRDAWDEAEDWTQGVASAVRVGVEFVMQMEGASRIFLVDQSGPAATDLRIRAMKRAATHLRIARAGNARASGYPQVMELTLIAGVVHVALDHLLAEERRLSATLSDELVELILTPYIGPREARGIARQLPDPATWAEFEFDRSENHALHH